MLYEKLAAGPSGPQSFLINAANELKPLYPKAATAFFYLSSGMAGPARGIPLLRAAVGELDNKIPSLRLYFQKTMVNGPISPEVVPAARSAIKDCNLLPKTRRFLTALLQNA